MKKTIQIDEAHYDVLKKWASVGRTIDTAIHLLDEHLEAFSDDHMDEQLTHVIEELKQLKQPLDGVNMACKNAFYEENAK